MAALISLSLWWIWLSLSVLRSNASKDQKKITAESGQNNVTLPCRAPDNNNIIVVEWSRADLGTEYVSLYRSRQFVPDHQHPSFKNRVDLKDRQMKDGDVSLILKDVTINDAGTYECRVFSRGGNRRKRANLKTDPISSIYLTVDPPGQTGGPDEKNATSRGHLLLIAPLSFICVVFILITVKNRKYFCLTLPPDKITDPDLE